MEDDDFKIDVPRIIFLKGVFLRKTTNVDDKFYNDLTAAITRSENITYQRIPRRFYSKDTWIQSTNIHCWECDNQCKGIPVPIPTNMQYVKNNPTFDVLGICCDFPCVALHIRTHFYTTRWEKLEFLNKLFYIFYGVLVDDIPSGPERLKQERFGGPLSAAEFQMKIKNIMDGLLHRETETIEYEL